MVPWPGLRLIGRRANNPSVSSLGSGPVDRAFLDGTDRPPERTEIHTILARGAHVPSGGRDEHPGLTGGNGGTAAALHCCTL